MAANDVSREDRQLPASERRLRNARAEGRVPRSRDFGHALLLATAVAAFGITGPGLAERALEVVRNGMTIPRAMAMNSEQLGEHLYRLGSDALGAILPTMALMALAGIVAAVVPGGFVLTTKPLSPSFSKLNPMAGLQRLLSAKAAVDLVRLAALAFAVGLAGTLFVHGAIGRFAGLSDLPLPAGLSAAFDSVRSGAWWLVGVLVAAAAVDAPLQWFRHHGDLRMTHQEARDEHKEAEGDPRVKGRIRQRQREIGRARMLAAVPTADVVITNPTHYAVAVRYDEARMGAPRLIAKGADLLAMRIREVAAENGVPLFEAPPLARALYANVEVDQEIPAALYKAVAQVLAYVYQLRNLMPGAGRGPRPPDDLEVPPGMDPQERTE